MSQNLPKTVYEATMPRKKWQFAPDDVIGKHRKVRAQRKQVPIPSNEIIKQLPDSDLLKSIHYYVSYKLRNRQMDRAFDGTALLGLGLVVEEWIKDLVDGGGFENEALWVGNKMKKPNNRQWREMKKSEREAYLKRSGKEREVAVGEGEVGFDDGLEEDVDGKEEISGGNNEEVESSHEEEDGSDHSDDSRDDSSDDSSDDSDDDDELIEIGGRN